MVDSLHTRKAFRKPLSLRLLSHSFLLLWLVIAMFPLLWIIVMSFKLPIDAFAGNVWQVITGTVTKSVSGGLTVIEILVYLGFLFYAVPKGKKLLALCSGLLALSFTSFATKIRGRPKLVISKQPSFLTWVLAFQILLLGGLALLFGFIPFVLDILQAGLAHIPGIRALTVPVIGVTFEHYEAVWFEFAFYNNFINSMIVTFGVVTISLSVATMAGYAFARTSGSLALWLLIAALIFRALPHSVLVAGYLPPFIKSAEILEPIFGSAAPTLYGKPWATIIVLVAINQPFTIWMLRSFFQNIPRDLDEAARVDGCSHFGAFWRVIVPVMWPGVITAGLFSFLLAYNDYLVTSLLLDAQNQTMVPAITSFFNRETAATDQVQAIAAAVSITAPLFILVMVFQKQIVSGLLQGAVKT